MEKFIQKQGYDLHLLHTKKYKTINISFKFTTNLNRDIVTQRALLPYVLQQGTANYPTATKLRQKLDELFGAILHIDSSKKGEKSITTIRLELANERYLSNQTSLLEDGLKLLHEVIYSPKMEDNGFDPKILEREKKTLKNKMDALKEDKMSLANTRLIEEMCADEPYHLRVHGYEEDLASITPGQLYEYYQQLLQQDHLDIFVVGDIENLEMENKIDSIVSRSEQAEMGKTQLISKERQANTLIEKDKIQQAKLHFGYRTNISYDDQDYAALHVFNGLFGGFPSSKLFMNVREKHSLAYYAASRIESHKGLLFVFSGIAPEQYEKAREIIIDQMDQMVKGDFTDQQIAETKEMTINQLKETLDNPQGMIELHYQRVLAKSSKLPEQLIEDVKQVTKEDIIKVAQKIQLDMIYLLTSEGV
ncbi:EF-P 5-aminopentanol modification-associated protein YfmF [Gracilibacillus xinjiangensis]|uniref:EF-P 5-aminopentanol modification-associated protein YfmF n=1 Tax=Gracilibacillus xinjiangensis TaxID=1193282 RepID=A0ABV8WZY0_9BACI